jgi:hypothetical protein
MFRRFLIATGMSALMMTGCAGSYSQTPYGPAQNGEYDQPGTDVGMFADLSAYGGWRYLDAFGWVWQPRMTAGWQPYYNGHWAWTDYGWTWVSYEPFGWATYHYGYWIDDADFGWLWMPGYRWAPSRVEWYVTNDYVCWAPLPPPGVNIGSPLHPGRFDTWIVVRGDRFTDSDVGRDHVSPARFREHMGTRSEHEVALHHAPNVQTIERFRGRDIPKVAIRLDRQRHGDHEFARIELPPAQSRIVDRHRVNVPRREPERHEGATHLARGKETSHGHGSSGRESGEVRKHGRRSSSAPSSTTHRIRRR